MCEGVKSENIPKVDEPEVKLSAASAVYDGAVKSPAVTVKDIKGNVLKAGTDYTVSVPAERINAGQYTYTVTGKNRYEFTKELTFTVQPQPLKADNVTLDPAILPYDGELHTPVYSVTDAQDRTLAQDKDYTVSIPKGRTDAGLYPYVFTGKGNYTGAVEQVFIITGEDIDAARVTLSAETAVYNGKAQSPAVTVTNSKGETLKEGTDYTVAVPEGRTAPGTYVYTVSGKGIYTGSVEKTFTVTPHDPHTWDKGKVTTEAKSPPPPPAPKKA